MNVSTGARRLHDLLTWFRKKGKQAYPKLAWLAGRLEVCTRTVKRWLAELRKASAVSITYHGPRGARYVPDVPDCVPDYVPVSRSGPYMSSKESNRKTAWVIERKPPEKAPELRWRPEQLRWAAEYRALKTNEERVAWTKHLELARLAAEQAS